MADALQIPVDNCGKCFANTCGQLWQMQVVSMKLQVKIRVDQGCPGPVWCLKIQIQECTELLFCGWNCLSH